MGANLAVGVGIGNQMASSMVGAMNQQQPPAAAPGGGMGAAPPPPAPEGGSSGGGNAGGGGQAAPTENGDPALSKFVARVKKLLSGEPIDIAQGRQGTGSTEQRSAGPAGPGQPVVPSSRGSARWWWVLPIFGVSMALILVMKEQHKEMLRNLTHHLAERA